MNKVKITLIKSRFGRIPKHRATIAALGLRKINSSKIFNFTPQIRGMIQQISYLLNIEESLI